VWDAGLHGIVHGDRSVSAAFTPFTFRATKVAEQASDLGSDLAGGSAVPVRHDAEVWRVREAGAGLERRRTLPLDTVRLHPC
jgi:hypothetical protein